MSIIRITTAAIFAAIVVAGLISLEYFLDYWYLILAGEVLLAIGITVWRLRHEIHRAWVWLPFSVLFAAGSFGFVFILRAGNIRWLVFAALLVLWGLYFWNLSEKEKPRPDIGILVSLGGFFLLIYSAWQLVLLFSLPFWLWLLLIVVAGIFLFWPLFRLGKRQRSLVYSLILGLLLAQVAWGLAFWPITPLSDMILLLLAAYLIGSLMLSYFLKQLDRKRFWQYILLTGVLVILVISTSNWLPLV